MGRPKTKKNYKAMHAGKDDNVLDKIDELVIEQEQENLENLKALKKEEMQLDIEISEARIAKKKMELEDLCRPKPEKNRIYTRSGGFNTYS